MAAAEYPPTEKLPWPRKLAFGILFLIPLFLNLFTRKSWPDFWEHSVDSLLAGAALAAVVGVPLFALSYQDWRKKEINRIARERANGQLAKDADDAVSVD